MNRPAPATTLILMLAAAPALAVDGPAPGGRRALPGFERVVLDDDFPGAYQVEVSDVDGDGRPDVVALGGGTCAWYRNPTWQKRVITGPDRTPGVISSATTDLDGDGRAEVAIAFEFALDSPTRGKLALARQGPTVDDPWTLEPVADVGSIHRLRFGDVDGDGRPDLVVAPIVGPTAEPPSRDQTPAALEVFLDFGGRRRREPIGGRPILHAIRVLDLDGDGRDEVLTADNLGVARFARGAGPGGTWGVRALAAGAPGEAPARGSSEVHVGRLADGTRFLATVEPWHGTAVAVHTPKGDDPFGTRTVVDDTLLDGHALWVADLDGDGDDEILAGFRGPGTSVRAYDWDGSRWAMTLVDPAIAAQDLRGGDLDGDGVPDAVAVGGKTANVVWYRPRR